MSRAYGDRSNSSNAVGKSGQAAIAAAPVRPTIRRDIAMARTSAPTQEPVTADHHAGHGCRQTKGDCEPWRRRLSRTAPPPRPRKRGYVQPLHAQRLALPRAERARRPSMPQLIRRGFARTSPLFATGWLRPRKLRRRGSRLRVVARLRGSPRSAPQRRQVQRKRAEAHRRPCGLFRTAHQRGRRAPDRARDEIDRECRAAPARSLTYVAY